MAVFVAAADESEAGNQRGRFLYGGFIAPTDFWIEEVAPAWEERVLNVKPVIPYLHMVEIRSRSWRERYGLTEADAERRVSEAACVIASSGAARGVLAHMDGGHFREANAEHRIVREQPQIKIRSYEPDFAGFLGFAFKSLEYGAANGAEKVDIVVERKSGVTANLDEFMRVMPEQLAAIGSPHLGELLGELIPGGKDRIPLQLADVALWHLRRAYEREADAIDLSRTRLMFDGKPPLIATLTNADVSELGEKARQRHEDQPLRWMTRR